MRGNGYIIGFATAICVVCSLLLSFVSSALKEKQEQNRVIDRQKNILMAVGFDEAELKETPAEGITKLYTDSIEELVIDKSGGRIEGKTPNDLPKRVATGEEFNPAEGLALYARRDPNNPTTPSAYAYPVVGKGLWSTLYGYLAVKPDGDEVAGLTFYKHGETPGLGAEIEAKWFRENFIGKKLHRDGKLTGVIVMKGLAKDSPRFSREGEQMVDGMSGATLTGNGVTKLMKVIPRRYEAFFKKAGGAS